MPIVFVSYGGGHVQTLIPVARRMKELGIKFIFIGLTNSQSLLKKNNIPFIGFNQFPNSQEENIHYLGEKLFKQLPKNNFVSREESIAYLGTNYYELEKLYGKAKAKILYKKYGRQSFLPVKTFEDVLKWLNADFVITTSSPRSERAAILAAKNLNISSLCVVDLGAFFEVEWIKSNDYASKVFVINDSVKNYLVSHGRNEVDIVVSGNPAFEQINNKNHILDGSKLVKVRKWDDGLINILWASQKELSKHPYLDIQSNPDLPRYVEEKLREFIRSNEDFRLIVRYHPSENITFADEPRVSQSFSSESIESILHAVDIVVIMSSTVGLQGYYAGKEVIYVKGSMHDQEIEMLTSKIGTHINSIEDLNQTILRIKEKLPNKSKKCMQNFKNKSFKTADKIISELFKLKKEKK